MEKYNFMAVEMQPGIGTCSVIFVITRCLLWIVHYE